MADRKARVPDYTMPLFQQLIAGEDRNIQMLGQQVAGIIQAIQSQKESELGAETSRRTAYAGSEAAKLVPESVTPALQQGLYPSAQVVAGAHGEKLSREFMELVAERLPPEQAAEAIDILLTGGKSATNEQDIIESTWLMAKEKIPGIDDAEKPSTLGGAISRIEQLGNVVGADDKRFEELYNAALVLQGSHEFKLYNILRRSRVQRDRVNRSLAELRAQGKYKDSREFVLAHLHFQRTMARLDINATKYNRLIAELQDVQKEAEGKDALDKAIRDRLDPGRAGRLDSRAQKLRDLLRDLDEERERLMKAWEYDFGESTSPYAPPITPLYSPRASDNPLNISGRMSESSTGKTTPAGDLGTRLEDALKPKGK